MLINKLRSHRVLYFLFMSFAAVLGLTKFLLFSKWVSVEDFGLYSLVMSSYIFLVFIGGMGFQEGILKKGSEKFSVGDEEVIRGYFLIALKYVSVSVFLVGCVLSLGTALLSSNDFSLKLVFI